MYNKTNFRKKVLVSLVLTMGLIGQMLAQTTATSNSPISYLGMGDVLPSVFMSQQSMGGLNASYNANMNANICNPASLSKVQFATLEAGLYYQTANYTDAKTSESQRVSSGNLAYFSLAFPITRTWYVDGDTANRHGNVRWGMSLGILPFSQRSYDITATRHVTNIGNVSSLARGDGSTQQVYWANGFGFKNFNFGVRLGYLFGKANSIFASRLDSSAYVQRYQTVDQTVEHLAGLNWQIGAQYNIVLTKQTADEDNRQYERRIKKIITIGSYLGGGNTLGRDEQKTVLRHNSSVLGAPSIYSAAIIDTLSNSALIVGNKKQPLVFGFGAQLAKDYNYIVGFNAELTQWDKNIINTAATSYKVSVGGEWQPKFDGNFVQRNKYRMGLIYGTDHRTILVNNSATQFTQYAITMGAGLPIFSRNFKDKPSQINLNLEFGQLSAPDAISKTYVQVGLGLIFNDAGWFRRTKFR